jgi:hypothetical protein
MIRQEQLLSELYAVFSEHFPRHGEFWIQLSKEEGRHAKLVQKLLEAAKKGIILFDEGNLKTYTLTSFLDRLENLVAKAKRGEFNLVSAFSHAVDYETSLIEKNVFSRFDSLNEKAKSTLKILQSETISHLDRIKEQKTTVLAG